MVDNESELSDFMQVRHGSKPLESVGCNAYECLKCITQQVTTDGDNEYKSVFL